MSRNKTRFLIALSLAALLASSAGLYAGKYNQVVDIGAPLPQFSNLPAIDGSKLFSVDLKEDVVVLVFLANHCPWVKGMDGDLVKLVDQFKGRSVRVVGVAVNHREEDRLPAMKQHAAQFGYNFTYVYDESQDLGRKLGATHTPEYFIFNKQRKLVYMGAIHNSPAQMRTDGTVNYTRGTPTELYVKDAIEAALSGKPVTVAETAAQGCTVEYEKSGQK
jgi:peroxiredoxin